MDIIDAFNRDLDEWTLDNAIEHNLAEFRLNGLEAGFAAEDARHAAAVREILDTGTWLKSERELQTFKAERALKAAQVARGRAVSLNEMGYVTEQELGEVIKVTGSMEIEAKQVIKTLPQKLSKYSEAFHVYVTEIGRRGKDFASVDLKNEIASAKSAYQDWKKQFDSADAAYEAALVEEQAAFDIWNRTGTLADFAKLEIKGADALAKKAVQESMLEDLNKTKKEWSELVARSKVEYSSYTAAAADKSLKAAGIEVGKIWEALHSLSGKFNTAWQHISGGMNRYLKDVSGATEFDSLLYTAARASAAEISDAEAAQIAKEVDHLTKLVDAGETEMFLKQGAKFMAPSSRMYLMIADSFTAWRETTLGAKALGLINPLFWARTARGAVRSATYLAMRGLEAVVGTGGVELLTAGVTALIGGALEIVSWLLEPAFLLGGELVYDLHKHGFSWRFLNDIYGIVGLSLEQNDPALALLQYPRFSKIAESATASYSVAVGRLAHFDWLDLSVDLDFWGARYIEMYNKTVPKSAKLPDYKKMERLDIKQRIPGLYIDPKNHPLDMISELDESRAIEKALSESRVIIPDQIEPSTINAYLPKQDGLVRNLASFPLYRRTFDWVDLDKGTPVQFKGNFSEADLDKTIVNLFKKWARLGTFGAAYNHAKTRKTQLAAAAANRADLEQFLNPKPDWFMAKVELSTWLEGGRARQAIGASDMVILAPEIFDKEWNHDIPDRFNETHSWEFDLVWAGADYKWDSQYLRAYNRESEVFGRYTYHPKDRAFLEDIVKHKRTLQLTMEIGQLDGDPDTKESAFAGYSPGPFPQPIYWKLKYFPSTADEIKFYGNIYNKGLEYRRLTDERKAETKEKWKNDSFKTLWKSYVTYEKPSRTLWGYIVKFKHFFMEELTFAAIAFDSKHREKIWTEYLKYVSGRHVPLNLDSSYRAYYMGLFAEAAYTDSPRTEKAFLKSINRRFGGILENDLVTTADAAADRKSVWAKGVHRVIKATGGGEIVKMLGHLQCRLFVLKNPRVIVMALRGTSSLVELTVDLNIALGNYISVEQGKDGIMKTEVEESSEPGILSRLTRDPDVLEVHRGFLRGYESMRKPIEELLLGYYQKYKLDGMFITGHSLGAALTQIAALTVPRVRTFVKSSPSGPGTYMYQNPSCYMFASPAVGDYRFQERFNSLTDEAVQIWNDGDAVTAVPPFLLSAPEDSTKPFQEEMRALISVFKEDEGMGVLAFAMEHLLEPLGLGNLADLSDMILHQFEHLKHTSRADMPGLIAKGVVAYNKFRPLRGGDVFMRLDKADNVTTFDETTYDSGNSKWIAQNAFAHMSPAYFKQVHSMEEILKRLATAVTKHPDLFDLDSDEFPKWAGGDIKPGPSPHKKKKRKRKHGPRIPDKVVKMITDGEAQVIGYARTKHHHAPWTVVPRSDVEEVAASSGVPLELERKRHKNSRKRHRADRHDSTYNGSDYI